MNADNASIVEIRTHGRWIQAAEVRAVSPDRMRFSYLDEYMFGDVQIPVTLTLPVGLFPLSIPFTSRIPQQAGPRPCRMAEQFLMNLPGQRSEPVSCRGGFVRERGR